MAARHGGFAGGIESESDTLATAQTGRSKSNTSLAAE